MQTTNFVIYYLPFNGYNYRSEVINRQTLAFQKFQRRRIFSRRVNRLFTFNDDANFENESAFFRESETWRNKVKKLQFTY